jgi:hypothetical protein
LQGLQLNNHALLDQCAIHNDGIYGGGELPHVCHYLLAVFSRTTVDYMYMKFPALVLIAVGGSGPQRSPLATWACDIGLRSRVYRK